MLKLKITSSKHFFFYKINAFLQWSGHKPPTPSSKWYVHIIRLSLLTAVVDDVRDRRSADCDDSTADCDDSTADCVVVTAKGGSDLSPILQNNDYASG